MDMNIKPSKILVGMSGGLDSTMTALLLQESGHTVVGLTLKTWHRQPDTMEKEIRKVDAITRQLGIEHHVVDVQIPFHQSVVNYFCREYLVGRTPNPCNRCNPIIKWPTLLQKAQELNCSYIATGHYVQKEFVNNKWYIKRGMDLSKDQSYFLWNLDQPVLEKALFPLGDMTKSEVRQLAISKGLQAIAQQNESMGVCFLDGTNYREFLAEQLDHTALRPGDIVDEKGNVLGKHNGIAHYTIGQKKGLGLNDTGWFVAALKADTNQVVVSKTASLKTESLNLKDYYLVDPMGANNSQSVSVRIRGIDTVPMIPGTIQRISEDKLKVVFEKPAWGITPGQSIVFYDNDLVIGGGIV